MIQDLHHLGLTVRDVEASARWYEQVLGFQRAGGYESPDGARRKVFLRHPGLRIRLGLTEHRHGGDDRFDETRIGLDHLAFRVASKAELDDAAKHLDDIGIEHEPIKDIGPSYILEFRDPDNIALELTAPK